MAVPVAPPYLPSPLAFLAPLKLSSSIRTLKFPRSFCFVSQSLQSPSFYTEDDPAIGDCLVFEEGIFEDPSLDGPDSPTPTKIPRRKKKLTQEIPTENLVPDEWRETQAEINITKKERRRIAQEMQFNSRLERKTRGLAPVRSVNLDEYKAFREAKLAQLKPLYLDNNPAASPEDDEDSDEAEAEFDDEDEYEYEHETKNPSERVAPRNPRWAVYGKGFDDVNDFFRSGKYQPGEKNPGGRRKLFTKEEKVFLNRRIPDLAAVTCVKWQPLHTLAASGEFYLMNTLLKHNLDINSVDAEGVSALHKAIIGKKQAITSYLLRESANPFIRDADGGTLMHYAVQTASIPAIKLLLLYNVDINLQDNDGWSPLHLAVQAQRTDIVKLLLIKGADKTLTDKDGLTPLELCLHLGRDTRTLELIKLLKLYPRKSTALTRKRSLGSETI
ncbi:unnamed protein product [Linum tenue]|uniref:Ankyrin repeat domain-containing protein, chloroplastic n=1 Tax=Linum tenue TaxID=586396 RepID=A0AAV0I6D9_9ROSI|nr:unnamed protein product [Linum tenue]